MRQRWSRVRRGARSVCCSSRTSIFALLCRARAALARSLSSACSLYKAHWVFINTAELVSCGQSSCSSSDPSSFDFWPMVSAVQRTRSALPAPALSKAPCALVCACMHACWCAYWRARVRAGACASAHACAPWCNAVHEQSTLCCACASACTSACASVCTLRTRACVQRVCQRRRMS